MRHNPTNSVSMSPAHSINKQVHPELSQTLFTALNHYKTVEKKKQTKTVVPLRLKYKSLRDLFGIYTIIKKSR